MTASYRLSDLAARLSCPFEGDGEGEIRGVAGFFDAKPGELTFATQPRHFESLEACRAGAIIVPANFPPLPPADAQGSAAGPPRPAFLRSANPYHAFALALELFHPPVRELAPGIDPLARVCEGARVGEGAAIGPFVFVGRDVVIGERCVIGPNVTLGEGVLVGPDTRLAPGVSIAHGCVVGARCILHSGVVAGSDGFGFTRVGERHHKIPQVGVVVIGDDVEIGANCTIDRGALGPTVIGEGTKIDNLVHIAHNVRIGPHSIIVAQVGVSGSVSTGHHVTIAGQAGIVGHVKIGSNVTVAARSVVTGDLPDGAFVMGFPAKPDKDEKKILASLRKLPELIRKVQQLERRLRAERKGAPGGSAEGDAE